MSIAKPHTPALLVAAMVCATLMMMGGSLVHMTNQRHSDRQRLTAYTVAARAAVTLEHQLSRSLSSAYALASWVRKRNGDTTGFDGLAENLIYLHNGITSVQLVSGGAIVRSYPSHPLPVADRDTILRLSGSLGAQDDPRLRLFETATTTSGESTVVGYLPIYLASEGPTKQRLWGYSVVRIMLKQLLDASDLSAIFRPGYRYALYRRLPAGDVRFIAGSDHHPFQKPVSVDVATPAGAWVLSAAPKGGWTRPATLPEWVVLIAVSLFTAAGAYLLVWRQAVAAAGALHDPLTGLPNRLLFQERALLAIEQAKRNQCHAAFLFLDLDSFKPINDAMGHSAGDRLLGDIAQRLKCSLRTVDTIARVGGDEFLVVLTNLKSQDYAEAIAGALINELQKPFQIHGTDTRIGVSIGISLFPRDGDRLADLVTQADSAMYRAKRRGGNCFQGALSLKDNGSIPALQAQRT